MTEIPRVATGAARNAPWNPTFVCPTPDQPCVSTVRCGDGKIGGTEQCDDNNSSSGDGCGATCQLEPGWSCPVVAAACTAKPVATASWRAANSATMATPRRAMAAARLARSSRDTLAVRTSGIPRRCPPSATTVCGDGHKEGSEQCDDGNLRPFDGCSPTCTNEPKCGYPNNDTAQPYQCFSVCGDGIKMPNEQCDDGNLQNGDGCSSTCTIEPGYACPASAPALGASLTVPILYRDFNWHHPQFEVAPAYDRRQARHRQQRHRGERQAGLQYGLRWG
jgi:cysteine-rich repeat protein